MNRLTLTIVGVSLTLAAGCASPLDHFNRPPSLSAPGDSRSPLQGPTPERMRAYAGQAPSQTEAIAPTSASLWRSGPESLFGDRRARTLGDIVTVIIELDEEAEIRNRTNRSRSSSDDISVPAMLGAPALAQRILPGGASLDPAIEASSNSSSSGDGKIRRAEKITLRIAATVDHVLPNGHLSIIGSQEIRVNYELRDLQIAGIIRPEDISRANIITYEKIADARISYGGRGQVTDLQKARFGQQILDLVSPF